MMETGDPNKYKRGSSTWNTRGTAVPPPVSPQNKTPGVAASKHVRNSNQGTVGARPKQTYASETEKKYVAGAENVDKAKMSQNDIIKLASHVSAEYSEESSDDDTFEDLIKPKEFTSSNMPNTGTYGIKTKDKMLYGFTHKKNNQHIILCTADIKKMKVDAIVNAADEHLKHMGGVAKEIYEAARPGLQKS